MEVAPSSRRESQVLEFQRKFGSHPPRHVAASCPADETGNYALKQYAAMLGDVEMSLKNLFETNVQNARLLRAKLIVGETAEVLEALAAMDEVELADGLADLEYVVVGTAISFGIPLGDVFDEVHRSNMTKSTVSEAVANHSGDKGKGWPGYSPPRVTDAIFKGRSRSWRYQRGDRLATRDGRFVGNATVTKVETDGGGVPTLYEVLTDYGNAARMTPSEICSAFYAEPIGSRSLRGERDEIQRIAEPKEEAR